MIQASPNEGCSGAARGLGASVVIPNSGHELRREAFHYLADAPLKLVKASSKQLTLFNIAQYSQVHASNM